MHYIVSFYRFSLMFKLLYLCKGNKGLDIVYLAILQIFLFSLCLQVDSSHYPKWTELIGDLLSKGIRTLTYINPLFSNVTLRGTPYTHNYFEEGLKNDYFIKLEDGSVWSGYGNSSMVDLSQLKAYEWMINIITKVYL